MMLSPVILVGLSFSLLVLVLVLTPILSRNQKLLVATGYTLITAASLAAVAAGIWTVASGTVHTVILPAGLPDLPFHLRLDLLSGYFLVVVGLLSSFVSIYSIGYVGGYIGRRPVTRVLVFSVLFLAGMFLVVLA